VVVFGDVDEATGAVFVSVKDDGCGFDPAVVVEGVGMTESIRARLAAAGGRAEFASVPGEGAEVRMWLPTR
jgi:signal transduction histidine kinase